MLRRGWGDSSSKGRVETKNWLTPYLRRDIIVGMSFSDKIDEIADEFVTDLRQHGIYVESFVTGIEKAPEVDPDQLEDLDSARVQDMMSAGQIRVVGQVIASVNDFAWEDRNLYPEKFEAESNLSEDLMLDEEDIMRSAFEQDAKKWWDEDDD